MDLATAFVRVRADRSELRRDLRQIETDVQGTGRAIFSVLAQAFGAAMFTAKMRNAVNAASNLNETLSKTKVIFGQHAKEMEKVAETAARTMGMSRRAYLDAAAGLKGMLDNMGLASAESTRWSQDLTRLGSDLASFFNTAPADAIYAISAALRGETEPIRRYNVQLSEMAIKQKAVEMGLYSGKGALDMHAKAQAALAVIMEQTSAAQGDFARTADGLANSQRTAAAISEDSAASLGQSFLPVYTRVVQVVAWLSEHFAKLPAPVQVAVVALVGLVALAGPVSTLASTIATLGTTTLTTMGVLGLLAGAVAVAFAVFRGAGDANAEMTARAKETAAALKTEITEIIQLGIESGTSSEQVTDLANAHLALSRALTESGAEGAKTKERLGALGFQADEAVEVITRLQTSTQEFNREQTRASGLFGENAEIVADIVTKMDDWDELNELYWRTLETEMTPAQERFIRSLEDLNDTAEGTDLEQITAQFLAMEIASSSAKETLVEQARAQAEAAGKSGDSVAVYEAYVAIINEMTPAQLKAFNSADKAGGAIAGLGDAADGAAGMIEDLEAAFADLLGTLDARDAARNMAEGFDRVTEAYVALWDATDERPLDVKLRDWEQAVDDQKRKVIDWATAMGNVPESVVTDILADIDEGSFNVAEQRIKEFMERMARIAYSVAVDSTGAIRTGVTGKVASYDVGGYIDRDQVAMIHRNEVVLPLDNPGRIAALLSDPRVAPAVGGAVGGGGPSLSIGTLNVGNRDDLVATSGELDRLLWRVS